MSLSETLISRIREEFSETFCRECPEQARYPEDEINPPEDACPSDFDPRDPGCRHHAVFAEAAGLAERIEELVT